jgi:hypothetical protein
MRRRLGGIYTLHYNTFVVHQSRSTSCISNLDPKTNGSALRPPHLLLTMSSFFTKMTGATGFPIFSRTWDCDAGIPDLTGKVRLPPPRVD